ncbi:MAG: hypothetical protein GY926_23040 [bacterium]|nr:hypothetical protein [bacterium]
MEVLGLLLTTIGLITTWYFGLRRSPRAALDYEVTYNRPVLGDRELLGQYLSVRWEQVSNPPDVHILALKLVNSGRRPIKSSDFDRPLRITFDSAYLLGAKVADSSSPSIRPHVSLVEDARDLDLYVEIDPLLLNGRDWFEVQVFSNGDASDFRLDGRIEGVAGFRDKVATRQRRDRVMTVAVPLFWLGIGTWVVLASSIISDSSTGDLLWPWVFGSLGGVAIGNIEGRSPAR